MPLFRIETRSTKGQPKKPSRARSKARADSDSGPGTIRAVALGAVLGLIGVLAVAAGMYWGSRTAPEDPVAAPTAVPASFDSGVNDQLALATAPAVSIDYPPEAVVAYVNGEPYTMAELDTTVRIARVLGSFTGDLVPADGSAELPGFMVKMLRRQIDIILMRQAMKRDGIFEPSGDNEMLVDAFLGQVGATPAELDELMAANGVTDEDLGEWFNDARAINFYIQNTLLADQDAADRDAIVEEWLAREWEAQAIEIDFYDPELVLPMSPGAAPADEDTAVPTEPEAEG